MKNFIAPALLSVLLLCGCSPAPAPSSSAPSVPNPTDEQQQALVAELEKVKPEFTGPRAAVNARAVCRTILDGAPNGAQIDAVRKRFDRAAQTAVTETEAVRIVEIIKTNGFCISAS